MVFCSGDRAAGEDSHLLRSSLNLCRSVAPVESFCLASAFIDSNFIGDFFSATTLSIVSAIRMSFLFASGILSPLARFCKAATAPSIWSVLLNALTENKINKAEFRQIKEDSKLSDLERDTKNFSIEEMDKVIAKANPLEREALEKIRNKKVKSAIRRGRINASDTSALEDLR